MPKVEIDSPGLKVVLEATETSIDTLGKQALDMFREAAQIEHPTRAHIGFGSQQIDRRGTYDHINHNHQVPFEPVHAKETS